MKSADSKMSSNTFATAGAGSGYFATDEHYRHLAKGVVDALHRGGLILLTGDQPVGLPMLTETLRKAVMPRAVIEISCDPALDCREPFSGGLARPDTPISDEIEAEQGGSAVAPSPIFVFGGADRLSDVQIEALLDGAQSGPLGAPGPGAAVLVAHSSLPTRLEPRIFDLLQKKLAAHLRFEQ